MRKSNWLICLIVTVTLAALSGCVNVGGDGDDDDFDFDFDGFAPGSEEVVGSGVVEQEDRPVSGFTRVVLAGEGTLRITQGATEQLIVTAEDNLLPRILTSVQGDTLEIRTQSNVDLEPSEPIAYDLTVVKLDSVLLSGVGDITVSDLMTPRLALTISGVGDVEVTNLDADDLDVALSGFGNFDISGAVKDKLDVVLSGVGNVDISGTVNVQNVTVTGLGEYDARDLTSLEADISVVEQTATVRVRDTLTVTITGNGTVFYIGDPRVVITDRDNVEQISG